MSHKIRDSECCQHVTNVKIKAYIGVIYSPAHCQFENIRCQLENNINHWWPGYVAKLHN